MLAGLEPPVSHPCRWGYVQILEVRPFWQKILTNPSANASARRWILSNILEIS
jgi:hypothetical protein